MDRLPLHPRSDAIVRAIGAGRTMHADFGSGLWEGGPIGIPFTTVGRGQPRVPVSFEYASESDRGRYPIPRRAPVEGAPHRGWDNDQLHALHRVPGSAFEVVDTSRLPRPAASIDDRREQAR